MRNLVRILLSVAVALLPLQAAMANACAGDHAEPAAAASHCVSDPQADPGPGPCDHEVCAACVVDNSGVAVPDVATHSACPHRAAASPARMPGVSSADSPYRPPRLRLQTV